MGSKIWNPRGNGRDMSFPLIPIAPILIGRQVQFKPSERSTLKMPEFKVPAIEKLLDYTASGIGAVAGPMLLPWKTGREAKARIIEARANADIRQIEAESEARTAPIIARARAEAREYLVPPDADVSASVDFYSDQISQRIEYQEQKRQVNIASAVHGAATELGDKEVDDHEPDLDWIARYFDYVQDVSSDDMRRMWSKILAGEVESPSRTSLRTLDTLRNMTQRDAEMFSQICNFVLMGDLIFYNHSSEDKEVIGVSTLLHLQDCGLLTFEPNLVRHFDWGDDNESCISYHNNFLSIVKNDGASDVLTVPVIQLTTAGRELYQFAKCTPQPEYLRRLSVYLTTQSCELFRLENARQLADGRVVYSNRIPFV